MTKLRSQRFVRLVQRIERPRQQHTVATRLDVDGEVALGTDMTLEIRCDVACGFGEVAKLTKLGMVVLCQRLVELLDGAVILAVQKVDAGLQINRLRGVSILGLELLQRGFRLVHLPRVEQDSDVTCGLRRRGAAEREDRQRDEDVKEVSHSINDS